MRLSFPALAIFLCLAILTGCIQQPAEQASLAHPNVIIIRDFAVSPRVITLDPSFGFSLHRGSPGVPPRQRAAGLGRAAAFEVGYSAAERLREFGFDAVRSSAEAPEPGARALIVTGAFREINEGYRRRVGAENSHIAVDAYVQYQAPGGAPTTLMNLQLDSRQLGDEPGPTGVAARRGAGDLNAAARKIGFEIARDIAELARRNNWPSTRR